MEVPSTNLSFCIHQAYSTFEDQIPQLFQMESCENRAEREIHLIFKEKASSGQLKEWLYSLKVFTLKQTELVNLFCSGHKTTIIEKQGQISPTDLGLKCSNKMQKFWSP